MLHKDTLADVEQPLLCRAALTWRRGLTILHKIAYSRNRVWTELSARHIVIVHMTPPVSGRLDVAGGLTHPSHGCLVEQSLCWRATVCRWN